MDDNHYIRAAIDIAARARQHGNHPFGALLVDEAGQIVLEAENTVVTAHDVTGHAESNLVRLASQQLAPELLATCTLYTSTEPCVMCAGAIYWANIKRVVFGLSEARLATLTLDNPANDTFSLPCREVFARGQHPVEVTGPVLEEEALRVHEGFWS